MIEVDLWNPPEWTGSAHCPACSAGPGTSCDTLGGFVPVGPHGWHAARIRVAATQPPPGWVPTS